MMGGPWGAASAPGPGEAGFVAGTPSAPRVVRIAATANLRFTPDTVRVQDGETIRFEVTAMGPVAHEFMVGPAAAVAADTAGTPEVTDISMMQTGLAHVHLQRPGAVRLRVPRVRPLRGRHDAARSPSWAEASP